MISQVTVSLVIDGALAINNPLFHRVKRFFSSFVFLFMCYMLHCCFSFFLSFFLLLFFFKSLYTFKMLVSSLRVVKVMNNEYVFISPWLSVYLSIRCRRQGSARSTRA